MDWYKEPPMIRHSKQRPTDFRKMIEGAAKNIHMRKNATALLKFYASHEDGFRPAAKLISKETGIGKQDISKVRKRLVGYGLIAYHRSPNFIYIDWERIRIFASLMEPLKLHQYKNYFFSPVDVNPRRDHNVPRTTIGQQSRQYRIRIPRPLTEEERRFFGILESMTADEYYQMVEAIRQLEFPTMPPSPARLPEAPKYCFLPPEPEKTTLHNY